jgi:hypothetical protein
MVQIDKQVGAGARIGVVADEGLRAYMLRVYNYMAGGVFVTGIIAYLTSSAAITTGPTGAKTLTQFGQLIYVSPLKWVIMLSPLAFVFFISFRIYKMSVTGAQLAFWLFAAAMGLSLSSIFLVYTGQSITQVLFVTAAAFGGLSLYGYTHPEGPLWLGLVFDHGCLWHNHRGAGQPVRAVECAAVRHLGDWCARVRRPDRLRHPANQGRLPRANG